MKRSIEKCMSIEQLKLLRSRNLQKINVATEDIRDAELRIEQLKYLQQNQITIEDVVRQ